MPWMDQALEGYHYTRDRVMNLLITFSLPDMDSSVALCDKSKTVLNSSLLVVVVIRHARFVTSEPLELTIRSFQRVSESQNACQPKNLKS